MLTNGDFYEFYIQQEYILKSNKSGKKPDIPIGKEVLPVLSVSCEDEEFLDIIKLFSKDTYEEHFDRIAQYVLSRYSKGHGIHKITDDKNLNKIIKEKIDKTLNVEKGCYLKEIKNGKLNPGDKLQFENGVVKIVVTVQGDGRVKLENGNANVMDVIKARETEFKPMIDLISHPENNNWYKTYSDPFDIIRDAINKRKLYHKEVKYRFHPI